METSVTDSVPPRISGHDVSDASPDAVELRPAVEWTFILATLRLLSALTESPGGVGKTGKDGDFERLLGDVTRRVFDVYPDATAVYPGHGDDTTLAPSGRI